MIRKGITTAAANIGIVKARMNRAFHCNLELEIRLRAMMWPH